MDIITSKRGSWTRQRVDWKWPVRLRKFGIIESYRTIPNHTDYRIIHFIQSLPRLARLGKSKSNCLTGDLLLFLPSPGQKCG